MRYEKFDSDGINFNGQSDFEISDPEQLPRQLARAAEQSGCRYKDTVNRVPARFVAFERRKFALLPCSGIVSIRHQIYDLSHVGKPRLLHVPIMAPDTGMTASSEPGFVTWQKDTPFFHSEQGSDSCDPCAVVRQVYRIDKYVDGLVLVRVEYRKDRPEGEWKTIWETPKWPTKDDLR